MSAIGGYLGLELNRGTEYHADAVRLNTARNAFEYILAANSYTKVYLPYYTCDAILQPVKKLNQPYEFYSVDKNLEAIIDFDIIKDTEAFLYTNYFGLKDGYIESIKGKCKNLLVDNAQAFFALPVKGIDTFYSARKFFGVPDGAYLYSKKTLDINLGQDQSFNRLEHLLRRLDMGAEDGYNYFLKNENLLDGLPILKMSNLTKSILQSIDYKEVARKRRENYNYLHQSLKDMNELDFEIDDQQVPMVYPFLSANPNLRKKLVEEKIYTAQYWPDVLEWANPQSIEFKYAQQLVHLPVDQSLNQQDLDRIIKLVK